MKPIRVLRRSAARTPLWLRLVAGTLLLVTLAIMLTGGAAIELLHGYLVARVDRNLEMASAVRPPPEPPLDNLRRVTVRPQRAPGAYYVVILDAQGRVDHTVSEPPNADLPNLSLSADETAALGGRPFTVESPSGSTWRAVAVAEDDGGTKVIAVGLTDVQNTVSRLAVIVVCVGAGVLLILAFAGHWLVRRSLRPLTEIETTAQAIAGGDLSRRVPARHRRTEMGRLGAAINGMLTQIEAAFRAREASEAAAREAAESARRSAVEARRSEDRMRRFVADASHELRTPLTSIRGFAELFRQEGAADLATASRLLRRIEDEARRMGLLVDDLLLLARLDRQRPLLRHPVDVLALAAGAVLDARMLAPDREIDLIRLDGADTPLVVIGDEPRLRQVIGNLVGNALRHTPPGTPFRIGVGASPSGEVVIEVADEGPGMSPEDTERVFERFYRADPARSRTESGGTGLGLPIAAALVQAHDGTITVTSAPGQGTTFQVRLPAQGRSTDHIPPHPITAAEPGVLTADSQKDRR
ncbi:HAMP domain-containing sensor histidine kinase [Thermopolyspora sp. NPDC052614]|uniref:HAMP domain-containing sensor histidine kinase n=1 Tax=Thermopolyspora sp. NPDC052614 TaxID=3155682 RepID=UPI003426816C